MRLQDGQHQYPSARARALAALCLVAVAVAWAINYPFWPYRNRLVDQGNTIVVIEHNLDVIKSADWVIDLGPEGGEGGGRIVAQGTPEQVARAKGSVTGVFLADVLR